VSGEFDASTPWRRAVLAAALFAVDPVANGLWLRAGAGPVRDAFLEMLSGLFGPETPWRKAPLGVADDRLLGGLDVAATLRAGRAVVQAGLLAEADGGVLILPMAERIAPSVAGRVAAAIDRGVVTMAREGLEREWPARFGVVAHDEGLEDETPPLALTERLGFVVDLREIGRRDIEASVFTAEDIAAARGATIEVDDKAATTLTVVAARCGVVSLRAPLFALRAARALAALAGRERVDDDDVGIAAALTIAPRATQAPAPDEAPPEQPPPPPPEEEAPPETPEETPPPEPTAAELEEVVLEAVRAALPADLLSRLAVVEGARRKASSLGKSGAASVSKLRGRPMEARPGSPREGRLALVATLRAAAPWQRLRRGEGQNRLQVRGDDLRITRYKQRKGTTTVFVVDASGSQAMRRLAEVKGAIEQLLADCYVRRDSVALVAFRGKGAEIVLPPTRSIARARRTLAGLPGGGGTPLASGLDLGLDLSERIARKGETPLMVLMTDGRANIGRDGGAGREKAAAEALEAAKAVRLSGIRTLAIDSAAPARRGDVKALADAMQALYLPLPFADSGAINKAVRAASGA
jgi:magnesium chelatase subunit D